MHEDDKRFYSDLKMVLFLVGCFTALLMVEFSI